MAEKIAEAADEVGVGRGAGVGSRREEMGIGREAAQYLRHPRGREVSLAQEAGAEPGGIAGMAEREGSKRKVGVR